MSDEFVRRRLVDRRIQPRFEVVGDLWGTVETGLRLPLGDVGPGGALLQSHVPLALDSIHRMACDAESGEVSAQVRVRHLRGAVGADGEQAYWVGVEFLARSPAMSEQIQRWRASGTIQARGSGQVSAFWNGVERRRAPRVSLDGAETCRLVMRARVRLLDVSATGALIAADTALPIPSVGQLRTALVTGSFAPVIEVLRQNPVRHDERRELGVRFQSMDDKSREQLEGFLKRASQ